MKHGFTLVELSIVLVIIGLLIGGILVAQSMVSTAKITAVSVQIGQFDAGAINFKTKYNYLPGDAPTFGGNGDGVLNARRNITTVDVLHHVCDISNFWNNAFPNEYKAGICSSPGTPAIISGADKNVPASKLGSEGAFFIASAMSDDNGNADMIRMENYYAILHGSQLQPKSSGWNSFAQTAGSNSAVKPADLMALDVKIDDGVPSRGIVLAGKINFVGAGDGGITTSVPRAQCNTATTYNASNNANECTPLIRIGGIAGNPL